MTKKKDETVRIIRNFTPQGREYWVSKARNCFPSGSNLVYRASCGDDLSHMTCSVQDHFERPKEEIMLRMLDEACNKYCIRGVA